MTGSKPSKPSKFFDETMRNYPWVFDLGDGSYTGRQGGYIINVNGREYKSPIGFRGMGWGIKFVITGNDITYQSK